MEEFDLIGKLIPHLPSNKFTVRGAGDDCAVLDVGIAGKYLLFKADAVVEGVHFNAETPGEKVGRKALGRCLSDIAAMGGEPVSALITLGLKPGFDVAYVESVYAGLRALAIEYGVAISGGETTANPSGLFISVALIGSVEKDRCPNRSGAKAGDAIFVTGDLGGSMEGKHLDFEPRIREARWLTEHFEVHAMIDLSDGLAGDLRHVLKASGVGAELLARAIPVSRAAKIAARIKSSKPPLAAALSDGEDFELLFTVPSECAVGLLDKWKQEFPAVRLSCIGRASGKLGLRIRDEHGVREVQNHGYTHFEER